MSSPALIDCDVHHTWKTDDDVIAYLQARIIGHGKITLEECLAYHEGESEACEDYK